MRVEIVLFQGFDELDAIGPFEILKMARTLGAEFEVSLVRQCDEPLIQGSHGLQVTVQERLSKSPDLLLVPGGGWNDRSTNGAWSEAQQGVLPNAIAARHSSGTTMAGVCTGAMLLAKAGLLEGRPAITHHAAVQELRRAGARIVKARVVDDGDIVTCGGVTSGLDLALWLVERQFGRDIASAIAGEVEHRRSPSISTRASRR